MNSDTNYDELARCTDSFNGAQLKAVCVEAGMIALRRGGLELVHEDYMEGLFCVCHRRRCHIKTCFHIELFCFFACVRACGNQPLVSH